MKSLFTDYYDFLKELILILDWEIIEENGVIHVRLKKENKSTLA